MASVAIVADRAGPPTLHASGLPEFDGLRLRIFDTIERGFGIVAVTGNDVGSHMLQQGEIAVYDADWHDRLARGECELQPGLYCLERQRPPASMPYSVVAQLYAAGQSVRMVSELLVVMVLPYPRREAEGFWAYRELRSRLHQGARVPARLEGPLYEHGILDMLRGPIVGIYRPRLDEVRQ